MLVERGDKDAHLTRFAEFGRPGGAARRVGRGFRLWFIGNSSHGFDPLAGEPSQSFLRESSLTSSRARNFLSRTAVHSDRCATNWQFGHLLHEFVSINVEFAFKKMTLLAIL